MPRQYKKKAYSRRPGYVSCGKMVASDAQKALAMAKYLKGIVNVEFKNHDVQATTLSIPVVPVITQCTNIAQGDTTITRDGASLKLTSLTFKYILIQHPTAVSTFVRIMIVLDTQTNEAIYSDDDLLQDVTAGDGVVSMRNLDNTHRFRVLYDRVHQFTDTGSTAQYGKFFKKLNLKIRYDNAAAAITSLTQSSVSMLFLSNEATNQPNITHSLRLRYVDN